MVRLVFSWNVRPNEEQAYYEFILQEFAPKIAAMGIQITEAWLTVYGEGPQIIMPGIAPNRDALMAALESEEWKELEAHLKKFVTDYRLRILDG